MSGFENLLKKKFGSESEEYTEPELPQRKGSSLEAFIQKHGNVSEEYRFFNNEITLRFNVEEHKYYRVAELGNLIPVNGVTNTVGIIDKSHMLTPWAAKVAIQKLLRLMPTEMVDGVIRIKPLTFEEFTTIALEAKSAHKDKLDEASDIGHMAHKCLEDSINYAMSNDPQKIVRALVRVPEDELAANAASSGLSWMLRHNVRWVETETKIYSREYDYAGTMDGLATCDSCDDKSCCPLAFKDHLSVIDWKSSNHLKIEYLFQTASYRHAKLEELPHLNIEDTWILRLGKNEEEAGKFEPWHMTVDEYEEDFQGFLACLRLTRLVDSVEDRMKSQKAGIRAVKKEQRETAKALAKEQEKLQKALDKAAKKVEREAEKLRIKAEAKAERERIKEAKKAGIAYVPLEDLPKGIQPHSDDAVFLGGVLCTSTSQKEMSLVPTLIQSASSNLLENSTQNPTTPAPETQQPVVTISTEETAHQQDSCQLPKAVSVGEDHSKATVIYETETYVPKFKLPMEG